MLLMIRSGTGLVVLALPAWLFSENRRKVTIKLVCTGLGSRSCSA